MDWSNLSSVSRELRGAGGGSRSGGGGSRSGGGGSRTSGGGYAGGSGASCKTIVTNSTVGNVTMLVSSKSCPDPVNPLVFLVFLVIPLMLIGFVVVHWLETRKMTRDANNKAAACERLLHTLTLENADNMVARGFTTYTEGWVCDKCNKTYKDAPFHRCEICDVDFCASCVASRPMPRLIHQVSFNFGQGYTTVPAWKEANATQVTPASGCSSYEMVPVQQEQKM